MKVTEIEGIAEYQLENGVRVLLFPDPSKEVVTVNMTVFVGSRHEGYGEAGMAHLLEHMLFKGTPSHPEIPKLLQDRGANFNGTTWLDRTNYYETLPATSENLEFALRLEADRLINSSIRGEDLASEMTVVRNEFERGENSPIGVLMERVESAAYDWHNYGRSTIGNRSDIERVPVVRLRRFYRKFYRPDNVLVIVAGKFDPEQALADVQKYFGSLAAPDTPIDATYTVEPPKDGERTVVVRRVGDAQLAAVAYHIPAGSHPDYAAAQVLGYVMGDEPSGRLYRQMVETGIASSVYTRASAHKEPGLFMALAEAPKSASIESVRTTLIELMENDLIEKPVTDEEVERAKQNILKNRELQATRTEQLAVSLSDWAAQGDWRLYFLFRDEIEALTRDDVQRVAETYFVRNNRTVGLFIPTDESQRIMVPEAPDLMAKLKDYQGREAITQGEAFDPDPLAIEARTERGTLVGGLQYAFLPKKTRGESVDLMLTARFGDPESLVDRLAAAELLGLMMSRGTDKLDYQQLQDELTRLRATLRMNSTPGLVQAQVSTKRQYLSEVITLLTDILKTPRLAENELEVIRRQVITDLEKSQSDPSSLAVKDVRRDLSPYEPDHVLYVPTIDEEIERYRDVTIDEIQELYENYLGIHDGEWVIVGDFDPAEVKSQIIEELEGWTVENEYVRVDQPPHPELPGSLDFIETPDKDNAFLYSGQQYELSDDTPEFAALVLGNFILGGGTLSNRLMERVRQQEGLSYGIRSGVVPRTKDNRTDFVLYAITNPVNKDRLLQAIEEELARLRDEGVTEDELARAKDSYLQAQRLTRSKDGQLTSLILGTIFNDRTLAQVAEHEQQIEQATVEDVNAAIRKFIQPDKLVQAFAGDFAAAEKANAENANDEDEATEVVEAEVAE